MIVKTDGSFASLYKIESIIRYTCSKIWWSWNLVQNILLLCQWTSDFWKYPVSILSNLFCFQFGCDGPSSLSSIAVGRYKFHWPKVNIQNKFSNRSPYWLCHTRGWYSGATSLGRISSQSLHVLGCLTQTLGLEAIFSSFIVGCLRKKFKFPN